MLEPKKLGIILINFFILVIVSTIGYALILKVSILDAIYMTMITISTVGFAEIAPLETGGKIFTIIIILWGVGSVAYTFSTVAVAFISGKIRELWRNKMLDSRIANLKNHCIICGAGNTGQVIIDEFVANGLDFVVIENNSEKYFKLTEQGILCLQGDATDDDILEQAQIKNAKGLIAALAGDMDNIMTVLSARQLNKNINIISKAKDDKAPKKLQKAGANRVIASNQISGRRMAALMLRPDIITFLDLINSVGNRELVVQDIIVKSGSTIENKTLAEAEIPKKTGLTILAIQDKQTKNIRFNMSPEMKLKEGDTLMTLGTNEQASKLRKLAGDDGLRQPK